MFFTFIVIISILSEVFKICFGVSHFFDFLNNIVCSLPFSNTMSMATVD